MLSKNLKLLSMLDKIEIEELGHCYRIWLKDPCEMEHQLFVEINKKSNEVIYAISNVTNMADYYVVINTEDLKELQNIIKTLME